MTDELLKMIPRAAEVVNWFGRWPAFHDAEISELALHHGAVFSYKLYAWTVTSDIDERGYYRNEKYADIKFRLQGVTAINLIDLTETGILFDLVIESAENQLVFVMSSSYGVNGTIACTSCTVDLEPR